jgi:hypothetical protein
MHLNLLQYKIVDMIKYDYMWCILYLNPIAYKDYTPATNVSIVGE